MISAFGVEHVISKAKIPGPKYVPTPEQRAANTARKAQQAAESARLKEIKFNTRTGGGKKVGWKQHRAAMGRTPEGVGAALLGAGGAFGVLNHRTRIEKADSDRSKNLALGATGGALVGGAAQNVVGQAGKITLKERRAARGQSPKEAKIWADHQRKYPSQSPEPFLSVKRNDAGKLRPKLRPNKASSYANYPKDLPDWKGQRALAQVARQRTVVGAIGLGAAGGAAYGVKRSKR